MFYSGWFVSSLSCQKHTGWPQKQKHGVHPWTTGLAIDRPEQLKTLTTNNILTFGKRFLQEPLQHWRVAIHKAWLTGSTGLAFLEENPGKASRPETAQQDSQH